MFGPPRWVQKYLGIRGVRSGNTFRGCHCFGLMQLVYERELGIKLSSFNGIRADSGMDAVDAINKALANPSWVEVGEAIDFDGVLMLAPQNGLGMLPTHIGLIAGRYILHVRPGNYSLCERVESLMPLIIGAYRYQRQ